MIFNGSTQIIKSCEFDKVYTKNEEVMVKNVGDIFIFG